MKDDKLRQAYASTIHVTLMDYFNNAEYIDFLREVHIRLVEAPFYSNISFNSVSKANKV